VQVQVLPLVQAQAPVVVARKQVRVAAQAPVVVARKQVRVVAQAPVVVARKQVRVVAQAPVVGLLTLVAVLAQHWVLVQVLVAVQHWVQGWAQVVLTLEPMGRVALLSRAVALAQPDAECVLAQDVLVQQYDAPAPLE
jgi:hypothetical protein